MLNLPTGFKSDLQTKSGLARGWVVKCLEKLGQRLPGLLNRVVHAAISRREWNDMIVDWRR
jgi:hypothetical protein